MEYQVIPESRFEEVIHHLRFNFPDEPLNVSVGFCAHGQECELLEHHDLETLREGFSLMALDTETGVIAGVALSGVSKRGDAEKALEEMKSIDNLKYHRIFGLLNNVNKSLDLYSKYNVEEIFDIRILSVDTRYRGKGLAKELFHRSGLLAAEKGFKLLKTDATSLFTQKVAESDGYTVAKSVKYGDYKDENGKQIYKTQSPHDYYKVMIRLIDGHANSE
ncbi:unnamed protein product [Brassicogethes aeneus]|uniref:aralkylamine N-acetyltransferase n=1 Tax=Brassicogethes aeneus TaxID=1431903 RepID=A0A9P0FMC9_BRAAE|nr:unnamed protein product [Brassicogethes aeneus]